MAVFDLYSKRKKRALGGANDVFTYDKIPVPLRTQVVHIWRDAIGQPEPYIPQVAQTYHEVVKVLRREYSVFQLVDGRLNVNDPDYAQGELINWFLNVTDTDKVLDAVELTFRIIEHVCGAYGYGGRYNNDEVVSEAIEELNVRFREHGLGYQYSDGQIVRVDSQLIHKEVVVPALTILRGNVYKNAQEEFLSAYEHFRHGKRQEALVDCYKCFESTMKVICTKRGWNFDQKAAGAKDLVNVCLSNGLIPAYWQTHFNGLRSVLESAISTPRNKQAGHGAGAGPAPEVPDELVSYVLHMTAATVLFLAEAEKKLR
jgi:Domain of unknown function (DUF7014)/AbiJ N-terminal domain 4